MFQPVQEKKIHDIQIGKGETKLPPFADFMIIIVENPMEHKQHTRNTYRERERESV